jgi:hypothetical protein
LPAQSDWRLFASPYDAMKASRQVGKLGAK